jgi:PilZ domain
MSELSDKASVLPPPSPGELKDRRGPERRKHGRTPITAAAEVYELQSQTRVAGRCSDLSGGGCYVDTLVPFAVGSIVKVHIERKVHGFEAAAVVVYAHVSMGMGLTFTEIKPEHQDVLRSWLAELRGEDSPEHAPSKKESEINGKEEEDANLLLVLSQLITLLVRKKIILETEGAELLRQIFR